MTDTATQILDTAQELIQSRGYSAISFQDIAERVGIKKPSIIHHFPSKAALGEAVIKRYRLGFADQIEAIKADPGKTVWEALAFYFSPYLDYAQTPDKVCLCGALAGEIMALPEEMHEEVKRFMESHQRWLEDILREGKENGEFQFDETPPHMARVFFSALQGALLVKRATGDVSQVRDVTDTISKFIGT
ncbi:MAG: hypothetical protein CBB87_00485 [Micavibrio sp. TMED27]|nr:TetR family transcriptional regulator [Micavibrio sp.]OUT92951.1 MAG: hypothetical protein CBB87_00485 [Micavibrio sp. TMED27]|tara:strand:- start:1395 stop:1964 length:570 start_codon:yes stop_codon:yes gene_type:complete